MKVLLHRPVKFGYTVYPASKQPHEIDNSHAGWFLDGLVNDGVAVVTKGPSEQKEESSNLDQADSSEDESKDESSDDEADQGKKSKRSRNHN
jgi:hypothetical protein